MANSFLFVTTPSYMKGYRTDIQVGVGDVPILCSLDLTADSSGKPITLPSLWKCLVHSCTHHITQSYTPIILCKNLKAHQRAWFYCQKQAYSTSMQHDGSVRWLGAGRDGRDCGGLVIRGSIQSCHTLSSRCFKGATPWRRCIRQDFWMPVRGGARGRHKAVCPAVPRGRLIVPNYFLRVFMSTSHMPFCFRNTKQLEMGLQTLWL